MAIASISYLNAWLNDSLTCHFFSRIAEQERPAPVVDSGTNMIKIDATKVWFDAFQSGWFLTKYEFSIENVPLAFGTSLVSRIRSIVQLALACPSVYIHRLYAEFWKLFCSRFQSKPSAELSRIMGELSVDGASSNQDDDDLLALMDQAWAWWMVTRYWSVSSILINIPGAGRPRALRDHRPAAIPTFHYVYWKYQPGPATTSVTRSHAD